MINTPPPPSPLPHNDPSRPLQRPGWGLIQDVRPRQTRHRAAARQPEDRQPQPSTATSSHLPPIQTPTVSRQRRFVQWLQAHGLLVATPLVMIVSIRLSALPLVGEILIVVYGLLAVIRRLPSRLSFWLATVVMAGIGLEFLLLPAAERANSSALFVFLLLGVGLVSSILETRRMARRRRPLVVDNTTPPGIVKSTRLNQTPASAKTPGNVAT